MNRLTFTVYPAIDLLGGEIVRLRQGDYAQVTRYEGRPERVAAGLCEAGARFLHVVDLDAARSGQGANEPVVRAIVDTAASYGACVQVGGGIRTRDAIARWLEAGAERVVIGTAVRDVERVAEWASEFGGHRLVAGLDGRNGRLLVSGWLEQTEWSIYDLARELAKVGLVQALVTDVDRDGTGAGPNLEVALGVQRAGLLAIASGGVGSVEDVLAAKRAGLAGAVVGKALHDGRIDLVELFRRLAQDEEEGTC
ncbi:1-(5-phosphoribosyl)-5-[(5-phosphoribosylamino)methylideneamino]imidazole-4-carboxamide isomerase [Alicyclobacillus vulcanalis]|uniref:1-(5-phosphoribosyl)-5-[(5-phosphoribosylamino)methylideneamino] imidazole-4-carboxamide isomerase n=1 Tax=Alicyclobacillus vulcanalis TaxID=252246 RepID=A0A1N7M1A9_9BACL|nr:1-(5-phosphoribosyl)-5-[(5-phosphoribosylamino)methylideneamino] imidazole-4-carboxamide isomerase [Alicyclobacillus vulcanalis]SIS79842.1 1-(5-phosphoribosyl)-5-[(5-phosphoribosylamino)methylideneamino] imidazole-4-carboxamide isomerase [Alicyclobacillus vulcanalis]